MTIHTGDTVANPIVSVFRDKFFRGARSLDAAGLPVCDALPLDIALRRQYTTDAHFAGYFLPGEDAWPRLTKSVLPIIRASGAQVMMGCLIFDFDNPGHRPWGSEMEMHAFLSRLREAGDKCAWLKFSAFYTTRNGARTVHRLIPPLPVDVAEQIAEWGVERFQKYGIPEVDSACSDWTRLFRLPYVTRDGQPTWEEYYHVEG